MIDRNSAATFHALHEGPEPLRLVNAWDALSARVFAIAGAPAIATSSFAVALAHGYRDGQNIPWKTVCETASRIADAIDVPLTVDIEAGQGAEPDEVSRAVGEVLSCGAVGINLEDGRPDEPGALFTTDAQCSRIAAARARADGEGIRLFVNARCDVFFGASIPDDEKLPSALERVSRYVDAGADGVFVPGLLDLAMLGQVVEAVAVPVNVMIWPGLPSIEELTKVGVRRISQGGSAFLHAVAYLDQMTRAFLGGPPERFGGDIAAGFHLLGELPYHEGP